MKEEIIIAILLSNAGYSTIAPLLPQELERKNVSPLMIGLIFAVYSVPIVFLSPFLGKIFDWVGRVQLVA